MLLSFYLPYPYLLSRRIRRCPKKVDCYEDAGDCKSRSSVTQGKGRMDGCEILEFQNSRTMLVARVSGDCYESETATWLSVGKGLC
jgi:hypothetical protein